MTRVNLNTLKEAHGFCDFADWIKFMPEDQQRYSLSVWIQRSRRGDWSPFLKGMGERSPARWRKSDIVLWTRLKFGVICPAAVQSLLDAGFPEPPAPVSSMRQPTKRKTGHKRGRRKSVSLRGRPVDAV